MVGTATIPAQPRRGGAIDRAGSVFVSAGRQILMLARGLPNAFTRLPNRRPSRCRPPARPFARHVRGIDQPDPAPALLQQPRLRRRQLTTPVRVRVPTKQRRHPASPAVEPEPRTRPVQHHRLPPRAAGSACARSAARTPARCEPPVGAWPAASSRSSRRAPRLYVVTHRTRGPLDVLRPEVLRELHQQPVRVLLHRRSQLVLRRLQLALAFSLGPKHPQE